MRSRTFLIAAVLLVSSSLSLRAQDAPAASQVCTALVMPSVTGAQGSAVQLATTVRDLFATYLTGPTLRAVELDARLPSQAVQEAQQKQCDRVLLVTIVQKHRGGGSAIGQAVGQAAGTAAWYIPGGGVGAAVARSTGEGVASAVSSIASGTRAKDELQMEYTLKTVAGQTLLKRSDKAKAQANGEDLITPLVERAAMAIAAIAPH